MAKTNNITGNSVYLGLNHCDGGKKPWVYRGHTVTSNMNGYWVTVSQRSGRLMADTKLGMKKLIKDSLNIK